MARRLLLIGLGVVILVGAVATGFLLGRDSRGPGRLTLVESSPGPDNRESMREDDECRAVASRLHRLLGAWNDIWSPFFDPQVPREAEAWRQATADYAVLEVRVEAIRAPPELREAHSLMKQAIIKAREAFETAAGLVESGAADQALEARALNAGDQAFRLWFAARRQLRRHPCQGE